MGIFAKSAFTGQGITDLSAYTLQTGDVGAVWTRRNTDAARILGNGTGTGLLSNTGSFDAVYTCSGVPAGDTITLSLDLFVNSTTEFYGLSFAVVDMNNRWLLSYGGGILYLEKVVAGAASVVAQSAVTPTTLGAIYPLSVTMSAGLVSVSWNGSPVAALTNVTATGLAAGGKGVGLRWFAGSGMSAAIAFLGTEPDTEATAFALTGPSAGRVNVATANYTVTPNGNYTGTITPTTAAGVTYTPASLSWTGNAVPKTFTVTSTTTGVKSIAATGSPALTPPAAVSTTIFDLALAPPSQSTGSGTAATLTATLTGGAGTLAASTTAGTLSTAAPTSGEAFTLTAPGGSGTATVTVTHAASGATATATVIYAPAAATAVTLSGPSAGPAGAASTAFTVGANGTVSGSVVVTPARAGTTFTPATVTLSSGSPTGTFTATAASAGTATVTVTNSGGLTNPAGVSYTATAVESRLLSVGFGTSAAGLTTVGYTLLNADRSVFQARTTTGVGEVSAGSGDYGADIVVPSAFRGYISWDDGGTRKASEATVPPAAAGDTPGTTTLLARLGVPATASIAGDIATRGTYSGGNITGNITGTVGGVAGVTFPATVASPTNITAGTITTVTAGVTLAANQDVRNVLGGLTTTERDTLAGVIDARLLNAGDATDLIAGIVSRIDNTNVNEATLVAAIKAALFDTGSVANKLAVNGGGQVSASGVTALPAAPANFLNAAALATDAVTKMQAGLSTYAGGDTAGTATILARVTGPVALASTALSNVVWTNAKAAFLDMAISDVSGGGGGGGTFTSEDRLLLSVSRAAVAGPRVIGTGQTIGGTVIPTGFVGHLTPDGTAVVFLRPAASGDLAFPGVTLP